jgi:hypothetical protein
MNERCTRLNAIQCQHAANARAYAIGKLGRNGFRVRRILLGTADGGDRVSEGEEIR